MIRLRLMTQILCVLTLGLMALGAGVRAVKAGLSCPDWPLCFGKVIPDFHPGVWFEFVHRAYAGIVALLFIGVFFGVATKWYKGALSGRVMLLASAALVVLLAQIVMGALTVLLLVKSGVVAMHLFLATVFFILLFVIQEAIGSAAQDQAEKTRPTKPKVEIESYALWLMLRFQPALILSQIILGGMVAATYAGYVCLDWPTCNGQWFPTLSGPIGLQIWHRMTAYLIVVWTFIVSHFLYHNANYRALRPTVLLYLSLVMVQVIVGILNLLYWIPAPLTVLHQLLALLLFASAVRLVWLTSLRKSVAAQVLRDPALN